MNYGNNFTLAATYNSRQQLQGLKQYRPGGLTVMDKTYQYYPDGKIKFSDDLRYQGTFNNRFDRAFTYDHVGRLNNAWAGSQARSFVDNLPPDEPEVTPYSLTYQYDVWGNQTSQSGAIWSSGINETVSYQSMRRDGWTYDAAGNVVHDGSNNTSDGSAPFKYDAAGRNVSVRSSMMESTQTFDGDGLVGRRDPMMPRNPNDPDSYPIFYMRSTVLGGKVIVEIDGRGTNFGSSLRGRKLDSHVYSGGTRIAIQRVLGDVSPIQYMIWKFIDPVTGTEATPSLDGSYIGHQVEPDPLGINVGLNDPAIFGPPAPAPEQPDYFGGGGVLNPSHPMFSIDGILVDQAFGQMMLDSRSGAAVVAPAEEYISIVRHGQRHLARWQAYADGYQGYVPVGERHIGGGTLSGSGRPGDTDLARINRAIGDEAELGRSMGFGFAFGFQAQRQQGGGQNQGVQPNCQEFVDSLTRIVKDGYHSHDRKVLGTLGATQAHDVIGTSMVRRAKENVDVNGRGYLKGPSLPTGFKQELIDNGQGGDVYHHIEFVAGSYFLGVAGQIAIETFIAVDRNQALSGRQESVTELRDDEAGKQVGKAMFDAFSSARRKRDSRVLDELPKILRGILCVP